VVVVVVVGGATGTVVVVVRGGGSVVVVGTVTGGAGGGAVGHITSVPNFRHCLMSLVRQRLNLPGLEIQPQEVLIALPQEARHCDVDATMLA
jgi:hypothetical protein